MNLEQRIRDRARHLWVEEGKPRGREAEYLDQARTLIAIEDNPHAATEPNPIIVPPRLGPEATDKKKEH